MIELGALLGAMVLTLSLFHALAEMDEAAFFLLITFVGGPIIGSLWGAVVAAAIHYAGMGALFAWGALQS